MSIFVAHFLNSIIDNLSITLFSTKKNTSHNIVWLWSAIEKLFIMKSGHKTPLKSTLGRNKMWDETRRDEVFSKFSLFWTPPRRCLCLILISVGLCCCFCCCYLVVVVVSSWAGDGDVDWDWSEITSKKNKHDIKCATFQASYFFLYFLLFFFYSGFYSHS